MSIAASGHISRPPGQATPADVCHNRPPVHANPQLRMSTAPDSSSSPAKTSRFSLPRRAWWGIAAAFGVGLLLFVIVWLDQRSSNQFFRAEDTPTSATGQVFEPLPAPLPGDGDRSASGLSEAAQDIANTPRPLETRPVPAPAPAQPAAPPDQVAQPDRPPPRPTNPLASGDAPQPISRPAPKYPSEALRNNETGTVVVKVNVGIDGTPTDVGIARSSRSRALDRAAIQAVRAWTFKPAQRDGQAVAGTIEVPIEFKLDR